MRYMMLMYADGVVEPSPSQIAASPDTQAWLRFTEQRGLPHEGIRLRPAAEGTVVRVRDGRTLVTDGPFAETTEQIAGLELIECADLDEAIEAAAAHPTTQRWAVDIRPFLEG